MDTKILEQREKKQRQVKALLASGKKYTAIQINQECHTADAHKLISVLRQKGLPIRDMIISKTTGTKVYWLDTSCVDTQLSIFDVIGE